jgi:hypothetical protein
MRHHTGNNAYKMNKIKLFELKTGGIQEVEQGVGQGCWNNGVTGHPNTKPLFIIMLLVQNSVFLLATTITKEY